MKKLLLLFVLMASLSFAQNRRFIYEYKYIPDINQKDTIRKDFMALDITKVGSTYQSLTKMTGDSIRNAKIQEIISKGNVGAMQNMSFKSNLKPGTVQYEVKKQYPGFKTVLVERVGRDTYNISEDEKLNWKISPEKQKIGDYNVQKATADFGGRSWVAWFSTDLPFQDGPYKFCGLPGLIVKLEDTTGSHIMTLVANKKLPEISAEKSQNSDGSIRILTTKSIDVNEAQFKKAWQNYIADPAKDIRGMHAGATSDGMTRNIIVMKDAAGNDIDLSKMAKKMEESVKYKLAHDNNKIEPSLYK